MCHTSPTSSIEEGARGFGHAVITKTQRYHTSAATTRLWAPHRSTGTVIEILSNCAFVKLVRVNIEQFMLSASSVSVPICERIGRRQGSTPAEGLCIIHSCRFYIFISTFRRCMPVALPAVGSELRFWLRFYWNTVFYCGQSNVCCVRILPSGDLFCVNNVAFA